MANSDPLVDDIFTEHTLWTFSPPNCGDVNAIPHPKPNQTGLSWYVFTPICRKALPNPITHGYGHWETPLTSHHMYFALKIVCPQIDIFCNSAHWCSWESSALLLQCEIWMRRYRAHRAETHRKVLRNTNNHANSTIQACRLEMFSMLWRQKTQRGCSRIVNILRNTGAYVTNIHIRALTHTHALTRTYV